MNWERGKGTTGLDSSLWPPTPISPGQPGCGPSRGLGRDPRRETEVAAHLPEVPHDGGVGPRVLGVAPQFAVLVDHQREGLVEPPVGGSPRLAGAPGNPCSPPLWGGSQDQDEPQEEEGPAGPPPPPSSCSVPEAHRGLREGPCPAPQYLGGRRPLKENSGVQGAEGTVQSSG